MNAGPSFESYLRSNKLVDEKYVSYYTNWVRQFVAFCGGKMPNLNWESMSRFLARLEESREDWQVRQASDALTIYTGNYLKAVHGIDILARSPDRKVPNEPGGPAWLNLEHLIRDAIALRRLSPNTERTYTGWCRRFGHYLEYKAPAEIDSIDVKNYLTSLAKVEHVSKSTQNQAFNSILFLFRSVDLSDLSDIRIGSTKCSLYPDPSGLATKIF